ncbi:MAG: YkuS family protein [Thermoanaerobacterales bacterium]|nr:YkuS family protein [Bacillota bacterium]MDI6907739.1 YkuS family protein [Thermoanaerobacterales bacterium]
MQRKVALAGGLGDIDAYFRDRGYTVLPPEKAGEAAALVISGATDDFTGDQRRKTGVPVINAEGKTPEEIFQQVERATAVKGL